MPEPIPAADADASPPTGQHGGEIDFARSSAASILDMTGGDRGTGLPSPADFHVGPAD